MTPDWAALKAGRGPGISSVGQALPCRAGARKRRDAIVASMRELQTRLDYINALLDIPRPAVPEPDRKTRTRG